MFKQILIGSLLLLSIDVSAQNENEWFGSNKYKTFLRTGLGFQWAAYSELGLSRMRMREGESLGLYGGSAYYSTIEWTPTYWPNKPANILGLKAGYETNLTILCCAMEIKYQTDFEKNDLVFTPKTGLNLVLMSMYYGYNISCFKSPFQYLGHHQLSIVFHYNRKAVKEIWGNN